MSKQSTHPPVRRIIRAMFLSLVIAVCVMAIEWWVLSTLNVENRVTDFATIGVTTAIAIGTGIGQWTRKRWQSEED